MKPFRSTLRQPSPIPTGILQNAQNIDAHESIFNDVGRDQVNLNIGPIINANTAGTNDLLAILDPVPDAMYNSMGAISGCMPGTREDVIEKIVQWVDGDNDKPICWLYAAAGAGKSAISKTVAERYATKKRLGASYFFLRETGRRSRIANLVSTLAFHLAISIPATRPHIVNVLQSELHIVHQSLEHQLRKLIIEPIQSLSASILPIVIVIDALDECDDKESIANIITIVADALRNHRFLRFLFTSRVEDHIQRKFSTSSVLEATYCLALHDFRADNDIFKFFRSRFTTIYQENSRLMQGISIPWPPESIIDELVEKSDGSFIFAFTLVNFVNDGSDLPHRQLAAALETHAGLDPLYTQVLRSARRSPHFIKIFETIITITTQISVAVVAYLLRIDVGDVIHALLGVQSILNVPENNELPIRLFHTSLRDFLTTRARSNDLFIEPSPRHLSIALDCLTVMVIHKDDNFYEHEGLKFACRSWCHHLLSAIRERDSDTFYFSHHDSDDFMRRLIDFASQSFDLWVNSVIVQGRIRDILHTLDSIVSIVEKYHQYPPNMLVTIQKVKDFAESDEKSFRTDNALDVYDWDGVKYRNDKYRYDRRGFIGFGVRALVRRRTGSRLTISASSRGPSVWSCS